MDVNYVLCVISGSVLGVASFDILTMAMHKRMKIIKFSNGKYGIMRWSLLGREYLDLVSHSRLWWPTFSIYFHDCMGNKETVLGKWDELHISQEIITRDGLF